MSHSKQFTAQSADFLRILNTKGLGAFINALEAERIQTPAMDACIKVLRDAYHGKKLV